MPGILYGVGVGPGDPELMTIKAVKTIRVNEVIACPGKQAEETAAYRIAVQAVPELKTKTLISVEMPMVADPEEQEKSHRTGAARLEAFLEQGTDVVFLTLGDPTIYSSFSYLQHLVEADGFEVRLISGIPSFCAAAAAFKTPLSERTEPIHIIPAAYAAGPVFTQPGNYVLMKAGSRLRELKEQLRSSGRRVFMAENCGMPEEKLYTGADALPEDGGYFSLIIAKK